MKSADSPVEWKMSRDTSSNRTLGRLVLAFAILAVIVIAWYSRPAAGPQDSADRLDGTAVATFAGGCFWCVEADFEQVPGVVAAASGYTGGRLADPTDR